MANDTFHAYNLTTNATIVTSVFDVEGDVIAYYRYLWTGLATIIANLFVLALIISDRGLRERLLLYAVLAVGDTLNGCYFGYANFNRLRQINDGSFYILITKWDCAKKLYSFFQLSGTQFPALIALLISVERVLAVQKPLWFYVSYGTRHRIYSVFLCICVLAVSLLIHYVSSSSLTNPFLPPMATSAYCALTLSSAPAYNRVHQIFVIVTRASAFALSAYAFFQASRKSRRIVAMRKETVQVAPILAVSIISLLLVTIPQIGLLLTNSFAAYPIFDELRLVHWILLLTCVNSLTNLFIYILFTRDFRRQLFRLVTFKTLLMPNTTGQHASTHPRPVGNHSPNPMILVQRH